MSSWLETAGVYLMLGASLAFALPVLGRGVWLRKRRRGVGAALIACGALLAALMPLAWIYTLVLVVCTGRNGAWIC